MTQAVEAFSLRERPSVPVPRSRTERSDRGAVRPAIRAAARPRASRDEQRLLAVDPESELIRSGTIRDLPQLLAPGDIVVVNDAATLPASLWAETARGERVELRLAGREGSDFVAALLGAGDWRRPTEERGAPPELGPGDALNVLDPRSNAPLLVATVRSLRRDPAGHPRLVVLSFAEAGSELYSALYRAGRPIQYSYLEQDIDVWDVQNVFAARPWGFEMPSAARGLSWEILSALRRRGIDLCGLTHAAGISSTGSEAFDRRLPLAEIYEIPAATARAIERAHANGGRVIAVGTTVVRALESAAAGGALISGRGRAELVLRPDTAVRVVDGVLSGLHDVGSSHFELLTAFAPRDLLERALSLGAALDYAQHEFGDAWLILPSQS